MKRATKKTAMSLRDARRLRSMSQESLEAASGVPQERISRLERGAPPSAVTNAILVARALNTTVEALFGRFADKADGTAVRSAGRERPVTQAMSG